MRKFFTLLSVALVGTMLVFTSCGKDEVRTNNFTVGGVDYKLISVDVRNYGTDDTYSWNEGYNTDLYFLAEDGSNVYFDAFSTMGDALDKKTYKFSMSLPFAIGTITNRSSWYDHSENNRYYFAKGFFTVNSVSGDRYEIEFSCEDTDGKIINGYYKGTVNFRDYQLL